MLLISVMDIEKKQQHSHAHNLLRECLKKYGISYDENTPVIKGEMGKPSLAEHPEIFYNLSHANGIAACYVTDMECGIDCEKVRQYYPNVVKKAFSESERQLMEDTPENERDLMFFRLWTLKESFVKTIGTGVSYPLASVSFSFIRNKIICNKEDFLFRQYIVQDEKYVVTICKKKKSTI